ncbi:MAG: hypothetical protein JKY53_12005 [Flavobacteriales bacterium]|nr:hypothetical protein [Flavobacteriales bacterium]
MRIKNHKNVFLALIIWCFIGLECTYAQNKGNKDFYETKIEELINIPLDKASVIGLPHPHQKGAWHFQYRYMDMGMTGTMTSDKKNTTSEVLKNFMMAPTKMHMHTDMGMIMYGVTNKWTLMAMANYYNFEMDMIMMTGKEVKMGSKGFGDTKIKATYLAYYKNRASIMASIGASLPTGSINQTSMNMMTGQIEQMPYNMQLGSGTVDPLIDICYLGSTMKSSWGIAALSTFRVYNNKNKYRLGNQYKIMLGYGYKVSNWFSVTSRFDIGFWNNIRGKDPNLNPMVSPNHRPDLRAGSRFELSGGLALKVPKGAFEGLEFIIDYRQPFYQRLKGPQMPVDHHIVGTLQWILKRKSR